jgi:hypothetical protein
MGWLRPAPIAEPVVRRVRLHVVGVPGEASGGDGTITVEGYVTGAQPVAGHYLLDRPKVIQASDETVSLGSSLEVPAGRVIFVEVLTTSEPELGA